MNFMKTYDKIGENTLKHPHLQQIVKAAAIAAAVWLLFAEGLAVCTLIHCGICLMGPHQNTIQRAIVFGVAVIGALFDSTLNTFISVTIHDPGLLLIELQLYFAQY